MTSYYEKQQTSECFDCVLSVSVFILSLNSVCNERTRSSKLISELTASIIIDKLIG